MHICLAWADNPLWGKIILIGQRSCSFLDSLCGVMLVFFQTKGNLVGVFSFSFSLSIHLIHFFLPMTEFLFFFFPTIFPLLPSRFSAHLMTLHKVSCSVCHLCFLCLPPTQVTSICVGSFFWESCCIL